MILLAILALFTGHPDHDNPRYRTLVTLAGPQAAIVYGPETETQIAGYGGEESVEGYATSGLERFFGVRGIAVEEQSDEPCAVWAWSSALRNPFAPSEMPDGANGTAAGTASWNGGSPTGNGNFSCVQDISGPWDRPGFGNNVGELHVMLGAHTSIYKVQVCHNNRSNDRRYLVKGIRAWGRRVTANGELIDEGSPISDEQPNCRNNWGDSGTAECPAGQVATALLLQSRDYGARDGLTGIALRCRAVRVHPQTPAAPRAPQIGELGEGRPSRDPSSPSDGGGDPDPDFPPLLPDSERGDRELGDTDGPLTRPDDAPTPPRRDGPLVRPTPSAPSGGGLTRPDEVPEIGFSETIVFSGVAGWDIGFSDHLTPDCSDEDRPCALSQLRITERSDEPCYISVKGRGLARESGDSSGGSADASLNDEDCGIDPSQSDNSDLDIDLGPRTYIGQIEVCTNASANGLWRDHLVKGVRIVGRRISSQGEVYDLPSAVVRTQPNCDDNWGENGIAVCPAGYLAHRLSVDRWTVGGRRSIVGLMLHCREVVFNE